jgi:hypothetical protein
VPPPDAILAAHFAAQGDELACAELLHDLKSQNMRPIFALYETLIRCAAARNDTHTQDVLVTQAMQMG